MWQASGQEVVWTPPRAWTAWPLKLEDLPREDLVARDEDEDDEFTYRNREQAKMPSSDLQDELSATVLRMAKERFRRRKGVGRYHAYQPPATQEAETADDPPASPGASAWDTESEHESKHGALTTDAGEDDSSTAGGEKKRKRRAARTYRATVSADDERSYELLRPPVRHILSRMDETLHVLHTLRANCVSYQSDSSTDAESDSSQGGRQRKLRRRRRAGEQQTQGVEATPKPTGDDGIDDEEEDGEERLPSRHGRRASSARSEADDAFNAWLRAGDEATSELASDTETNREDAASPDHQPLSPSSRRPRRTGHRLRLRDWSDVVGAASIAGFPPDVLARTARRCADLFGEGMVLRRFEEAPAPQRGAVQTTEYRPQPVALSPVSHDGESSEDEVRPNSSAAPSPVLRLRRHILSRQSSVESSSPPPPGSRSPSQIPSKPRSRSRSRLPPTGSPAPRSRSSSRSSAGQHFCPVATCERSASGFARRANLKRHMDLVHGGLSEQAVAVVDADSDEEVVGAVHVDGFLKTLVPGRGWRGEDVMPRKRDGYRGQRRPHEAGAGGGRVESTGDESS